MKFQYLIVDKHEDTADGASLCRRFQRDNVLVPDKIDSVTKGQHYERTTVIIVVKLM
jgi:hypothetical protein